MRSDLAFTRYGDALTQMLDARSVAGRQSMPCANENTPYGSYLDFTYDRRL